VAALLSLSRVRAQKRPAERASGCVHTNTQDEDSRTLSQFAVCWNTTLKLLSKIALLQLQNDGD
jgi:hypothetical protein